MTVCTTDYAPLVGRVFAIHKGELRGEVGRVLALDNDDEQYCVVELTGVGIRVVECAWIQELVDGT